jgi:hypothetical protein
MTRLSLLCAAALLAGCPVEPTPTWRPVASGLDEAALSVAASEETVWVVGADRSRGPLALRFKDGAWTRFATGFEGDLWWVQAFPDGQALMGGTAGLLLRFDGEKFVRLATPSFGRQTIFGIWGASATDAWIVGGAAGRDGFIWRLEGDTVSEVAVPTDIPHRVDGERPALLKVWRDLEETVWVVGDRGAVLTKKVGASAFTVVESGTTERLFTVHGSSRSVTVVGGNSQGTLIQFGAAASANLLPESAPLLQGVVAREVRRESKESDAWAVGAGGAVFHRTDLQTWTADSSALGISAESLHAVAIDGRGRVWTVGGNVLTTALDQGVVQVRSLDDIAPYTQPEKPMPVVACPAALVDPKPNASIARRWNEQILNAIRRDTPRPGVHARNLFHLSAAMYDAWAAFDATADGVFFREKTTLDVSQRDAAISYAAFRVLEHRYRRATGGATSSACFHDFMGKLQLDPQVTDLTGSTAAALGNRIADAIIKGNADDGANEANDYGDPTWTPLNPPLVVDLPGTTLLDPSKFQRLNLAQAVTQNGIVVPGGVQGYIGAGWGNVKPFALGDKLDGGLYLDPGEVPRFDAQMKTYVVDVIEKSAWLDPNDPATIDLGPGALGNNPLGTNTGTGHAMNPATQQPYASNVVKRSDFGRVLAEFWADGPKSETPPGHWNTLANEVSDSPSFERRWRGTGPQLSPLEWDVKTYLAINGAVHDAAIVAWGIKRKFECARPISLIRYMAGLGQSSNPSGPKYHADGLPLVPGLIEVVTEESAAPGERHAHLHAFIGTITIRAWRGEPGDRRNGVGGVGWIRGVEWVPYQRRTFVTPAFPGFTSGHSTFSRAAAEVLTELTGSAFFPGGLATFSAPVSYLTFEKGPSVPITLQWATYFDAADQAGQSRLWGGIHIGPDDLTGRKTGSETGKRAVTRALRFFDGTEVP